MLRFVARQNIAHFRQLLEQEADPAQRRRLEQLLADEETKLNDAPKRQLRPGAGDHAEAPD